MEPFNLEKYLANTSRKVVTRDGKKARIICTDRITDDGNSIAALILDDDGSECGNFFTEDGRFFQNVDSEYDLFFVPEKKEGWINVYENKFLDGIIYPSKEEALSMRGGDMKYITTIKIVWDE